MSDAKAKKMQKLREKAETMTIKQLEDLLITFTEQKPVVKQILATKKGEEYIENSESDSNDESGLLTDSLSYKEIFKLVENLSYERLQKMISNIDNNVFHLRVVARKKYDERSLKKMELHREKMKALREKEEKEEKEKKKVSPPPKRPMAHEIKIEGNYTLEKLQDFGEIEIDGEEYGINIRGDIVNTNGDYMGRLNSRGDKIIKGKRPSDWSAVMPGFIEEDEITGTTTVIDETPKAVEKVEPKMVGTTKPIVEVKRLIGKYTLEELQDFDELEYEDENWGINARMDVVDYNGNFIGRWDGKAIVPVEKPLDWEIITKSFS